MAYPNRMLKRLALTAFLMVFLMACTVIICTLGFAACYRRDARTINFKL